MFETSPVPLTPMLGIGFALSFVGIVYILISRNVTAKRWVAPLTIVLFSTWWYVVFRRSEQRDMIAPALLIGLLAANGAWVLFALRYCAKCGRTIQAGVGRRSREARCERCAAEPGVAADGEPR